MGLFRKSDPIAEATAEIAKLTRREEVLRGQFARAQHALDEAKTVRREALVSADDDDGSIDDIASDEVRTLSDRIGALQDALAELGRRRTAAEQRLAELKDRARREQIAVSMSEAHAAIKEATAAHGQSGRALFDALSAVSTGKMLAGQLAQFDRMLSEQIGELLREVESRRVMLLAGTIATTAIAVNAPPAIAPPPAIKNEEAA